MLWLQVLLFLLCLARVELKKHGVLIHTPIQTRSMPGPYPNPVTPQQVPIWTLLSEPTRKLAVWPVFQPPKLTHGAIAMPKQQGLEGRTGPAGHGRHDLSSSRQGSHRARSPHRNRRALRDGWGLRATAPTCLTSPPEPTRKAAVWPKTAPPPQPNSRALKDVPGLQATALSA